jgi:hypothetical protein
LLGHWRRRSRRSDVVIFASTSQVNDVVVVSVLQNAEEISFAQAFTVASEKLAGDGANLTRARGYVTNGSPHQIERFLAC